MEHPLISRTPSLPVAADEAFAQRNMTKLGGKKGMLLSFGAAGVLALLLVPAVFATAAAAPLTSNTTNSSSQQWAYSGEAWSNGTILLPNATYEYSAFYGWAVVFTSTNTSTHVWELEAQRTMETTLSVLLCVPNCNSPTAKASLSIAGTEQDVGFANFTDQATVYENGSAVPAIGLLNASAQSQETLKESLSATVDGPTAHTRNASAMLSVSARSSAAIYFAPNAFGLIPLAVAPGAVWNSTADYTAQGVWNQSYEWSRTTFAGVTTSGSATSGGAVAASGVVALTGYALGRIGLDDHSQVPVIVLILQGPFDEIDGIILVPHDYDLFSGSGHPWDPNAMGGASFTAERLDGFVDAFHHFRITAAAAQFSAQDASPLASGATTALSPSVTTSFSPGATVQAEPTSVSAAQQLSQCLLGNCAASAGTPATVSILIPVVAAVIVGTVAFVAWRSYSRRPSTHGPVGSLGETVSPVLPPAGATDNLTRATTDAREPPSPTEPPRRL